MPPTLRAAPRAGSPGVRGEAPRPTVRARARRGARRLRKHQGHAARAAPQRALGGGGVPRGHLEARAGPTGPGLPVPPVPRHRERRRERPQHRGRGGRLDRPRPGAAAWPRLPGRRRSDAARLGRSRRPEARPARGGVVGRLETSDPPHLGGGRLRRGHGRARLGRPRPRRAAVRSGRGRPVFDPDALGTVRIAAALADDRIAVVTFRRAATGDKTAIDVAGATVDSMALGFQPVALAATPDDPTIPGLQTRVWAASSDDLGGGVHGVAGFDVAGPPPWPVQLLDARAPTRFVAAARLAERVAGGCARAGDLVDDRADRARLRGGRVGLRAVRTHRLWPRRAGRGRPRRGPLDGAERGRLPRAHPARLEGAWARRGAASLRGGGPDLRGDLPPPRDRPRPSPDDRRRRGRGARTEGCRSWISAGGSCRASSSSPRSSP